MAQLLSEKVEAIEMRIARLEGLKKELLERVDQLCPLANRRQ